MGGSFSGGTLGKLADPFGTFNPNNSVLPGGTSINGVLNGALGGGGSSPPSSGDLVGAAQATAAGNLANAQAATTANRSNVNSPTGTSSWTQDPTTGQWTQSNQLSAPLQGLANTAQSNLAASQANPLTVGNLQTGVQAGNIQGSVNPNAGQLSSSAGDPNLLNQQVTNALYNQQTQYLDPQFKQSQDALTQQLANQGITQGSTAYTNAMNNANLQKQQAYSNAMQSAIGQGVGAANSMFNQNMANQQLNNSAVGQQYGQNLNSGQFANQAQNQQYNQGLNNAQLNNSAMNQQLQGNMGIQNLYGQQMQNMYGMTPQGTNYNQAATPGADILGAMTAQNNYNQGIYNAGQASNNSMTQGLFGLGAAALMSDIRTKENINHAGTKNGFNLYEFEYKNEFKSHAGYGRYLGVMAQEVEEIIPEAIVTDENGYKHVNYTKLGFSMVEV